MDSCSDRLTKGQMDREWMEGGTDGWMDGWMDGQRDVWMERGMD